MADSSLTFGDLILRVARVSGLANYPDGSANAATLPIDAHDLAVLKEKVNDARRAVYLRLAAAGVAALRVEETCTLAGTGAINAGAGVEYLPWYIRGGPAGDWTVSVADAAGSGRGNVRDVHPDYVAELRSARQETGFPVVAGVSPQRTAAPGQRPLWKVSVWPYPDKAYTLRASFTLGFTLMDDPNDREPLTDVFDAAFLKACEAEGLTLLGDRDRANVARAEAEVLLASAIEADSRMRPKSLGVVECPVPGTVIDPDFTNRSHYHNGVLNSA